MIAAAASVRVTCMVNPPLRVIINALLARVPSSIVFRIWFGYDATQASRGDEAHATRRHQGRSRAGRRKSRKSQQGGSRRGSERGVRRDRRERSKRQAGDRGGLRHFSSAQAQSARRAQPAERQGDQDQRQDSAGL